VVFQFDSAVVPKKHSISGCILGVNPAILGATGTQNNPATWDFPGGMILISNNSRTVITHTATNRPTSRLSEAPLLSAAKRGSRDAFETLCQLYTRKLFHAAYRITRNNEDTQDAVQDSLLRAFVHIKQFDGRSSFSTWLTRIAINSALMIRRKNRTLREVPTDELDEAGKVWLSREVVDRSPDPEQMYAHREKQKILKKAMRRLSPRVRAALEFSELREYSLKETAKILGISVVAAKGRLFHGRNALRRAAVLRAIRTVQEEPAA